MDRKFVRIDADALMKAGASPVLALAPHFLGGVVALSANEPDVSERTGKVALVRVMGPLAQRAIRDMCGYVDGYDAIEARFALAHESDADGVLMHVDSPGGDVAGLEDGIDRMKKVKAKSGKRVVAYVEGMAASAALWLAVELADEIVVSGSSEMGSIGCIGAYVDLTEQQKQNGATWTVIREPAGKAEAHPYAPMHDLATERLGGLVKDAANRFYKGVSRARDIETKAIRAMNGALYTGRAAVENGLADRVGTMEQAAKSALQQPDKGKKKSGMKLLALVAARLKLDADVTDADAAAKLSAHFDSLDAQLEAQKAKAAQLDAVVIERDELKGKLEGEAKRATVEAVIKLGQEQRKLSPAKVEGFREKAMRHGEQWAKDMLEELPVLIPEAPAALVGGTPPGAPPPGPKEQTQINKRTAARARAAGVDPAKVAEVKAAMLGNPSDGDDQ